MFEEEKILEIKEIHDEKRTNIDQKEHTYDGYEIVTDSQSIKLLIENEQNCCEGWGYLISEDNLDEFIGEHIYRISQTDTKLSTINLDMPIEDYDRSMICIFINIETSKGILQFVAYNEHNGYYGHNVIISSKRLKIDTYV